jgi:hypothetical protein
VANIEAGGLTVNSVPYRNAAAEAAQLISMISGGRSPHFAAPGEDVLQPDRTIRQALAEAQALLNQVCVVAIQKRVQSLSQVYSKQRFLNLLHLLTGSGFAVLLTNHFQEPMKWIGAIVSFGAAAFALWLPSNIQEVERSVFDGTNRISALSGEIARIEIELIMKKGEITDAIAERIGSVIASCREEALKWKLGQMAADAGVFPPSAAVQTGNPAGTA